jgi:hypothetical protein
MALNLNARNTEQLNHPRKAFWGLAQAKAEAEASLCIGILKSHKPVALTKVFPYLQKRYINAGNFPA